MIAGMNPVLDDTEYVFCTVPFGANGTAESAGPLAMFMEAEGLSMVLRADEAAAAELEQGPAMRRISLSVNSSLEGVGLTAAVSTALAEAGIACNVIAAYHHDHLFIPSANADAAMGILWALQAAAKSSIA